MVPLLKSVGYQLIYHTFSEKCEYFKFRFRPSTLFFFWRQLESQKNAPPPHPGCANFSPKTSFSAINNDKIILT